MDPLASAKCPEGVSLRVKPTQRKTEIRSGKIFLTIFFVFQHPDQAMPDILSFFKKHDLFDFWLC